MKKRLRNDVFCMILLKKKIFIDLYVYRRVFGSIVGIKVLIVIVFEWWNCSLFGFLAFFIFRLFALFAFRLW